MQLTPQQQALLDGAQGETMAKVVKTLVMYGDTFGAQRMVPVTSEYGHTVISFGLAVMKPVYDLYDRLIEAGLTSGQKFTADPRPLDKNVPTSLLEDIVFRKIMYTQQARYEEQLRKLGITADNGYTCTCYLEQVGNQPRKGDILSWAESSAVVYANSVLGARCNRNSGMLELMGSIAGFVPEFGLLTDEGRKAHWLIEVKCQSRPEPQLLGSAIGMKVMEDVPYVRGLDTWLGTELNDENRAYLKDFGAATASNGAVGLYHIENLTPEAREQGEALLHEGYQTYVIDDAELERVKRSYPVIWKDPAARLHQWTEKLHDALRQQNRLQVAVPTVFTAAPAVLDAFKDTVEGYKLQSMGVILSYICPLMYMNNPLCKKKAVITNSNKLRTYTSARYYTDAEILDILSGKEGR